MLIEPSSLVVYMMIVSHHSSKLHDRRVYQAKRQFRPQDFLKDHVSLSAVDSMGLVVDEAIKLHQLLFSGSYRSSKPVVPRARDVALQE